MQVVGSRPRMINRMDGDKATLIIRRLRCDHCCRNHHELPCFIVPYKRYSTEVIEDILKKADQPDEAFSPCEDSTVRRIALWFTLLLKYFEVAIISLTELNRQKWCVDPSRDIHQD